MPRKGHSEEKIVYALRQVEGGKKVSEVCRENGSVGAVVRRIVPVSGLTLAPWRLSQVAGRSSGQDPHATLDVMKLPLQIL